MLKLAGGQISAQIPKTTSTSFIAMSTTVTSSMRTAIQRGLEQRARRCCGSGRQEIRKYGGCTNRRDPRRLLRPDSNISATQNEVSRHLDKSNIVWGLEVGMASETVLDQKGTPHIFYYSPAGFLVHATPNAKNPAKWDKHELHEALGGFSARISPIVDGETIWISYLDWNFSEIALYLGKLPLKSEKVYDRIYYKGQQSGVAKSARIYRWATTNLSTSSLTRHLYIHQKSPEGSG